MGRRPKCETPGCGRPIPVGGEGAPEICPKCLDDLAAVERRKVKRSVYHREVPTNTVDAYRVLLAFDITDPCIQHAIKKLLCAGKRNGGKTIAQDVGEAIWTLNRWVEMRGEEAAAS